MRHKIRWTADKIARRLDLIAPLVYRQRLLLSPCRFQRLDGPLAPPPVGVEVNDSDWAVIEPNTYWAGWRIDFVLRTHFTVPGEWQASTTALVLPIGDAGDFAHPEALAFVDGVPYATVDRHHPEMLLRTEWCDGQSHHLALHGWTGLGGEQWDEPRRLFMQACSVAQIDQPTRDFITTARAALGIANALDANAPARGLLLNALDQAFHLLDTREPFDERFYVSVLAAHAALKTGIAQAGPPLEVDIIAAGHAHIDVAWLWTLGQTRRKAERTFHNVMRLMEQFPDYRFTQSQPQLYDFVRQDYPALFDSIAKRIAEGRWEPIGGMWVEADCNLSGAESLARQFLLGRNFFRQHFGGNAESPVLWLPDVFGYAWNLPQLIKQAGLDYFFTIKIGWSQYNRMPYDSFWWQGLDGTRVLTHYSTTAEDGSAYASTYNAALTPSQVMRTWTNFQQKESQHTLLMAYGFGDGGGGPTREMLENARELAAFPGAPRVQLDTVKTFFQRLEEESGAQLPVWDGELYLEYHRGTYTSQSRNKRANRQSEFLLHDAEFLATLACIRDPQYVYPDRSLRRAWELVCLNQFHDIIPGSSIGEVYTESQEQYEEIRVIGETVKANAVRAIAEGLSSETLLVNPTSVTHNDLAFCAGNADRLPTGLTQQRTEGGVWIDAGAVPPYSVGPLTPSLITDDVRRATLAVTRQWLENDFLRVELNAAGDLVRIFDKRCQREVLPPGAVGNQFQAFEDRPLDWDAWDVDIFYDDKQWLAEPAESIRVVEAGPLRATVEIKRHLLNSSFVQRLSLRHNSARLDFTTTIDWREKHILLKVAFPVEVLSPVATHEIQWGNVQRPTHRNTSWDWARFETCAHKWVDLSEGNYGVSLLNDCKYGHDIHHNVIRLSLLRSPTYPDPHADEGEHQFTYSLLPHIGPWGEETVREAYALNDPLMVWLKDGGQRPEAAHTALAPRPVSFIAVDAPHVVIETIKRAEDGEGVIVRLYECMRQRRPITLTMAHPIRAAWRVNLLEENQVALAPDGQQLTFAIKPYEIITLRLAL